MRLWFLFLLLLNAATAQIQPPRLIVRADDVGCAHSGNEAILKCYKEGMATSVEVIIPAPWFPEAVQMLTETSNVDVGVHLALSSEWDNVKWRPVSDCPSLRDRDGYFYPMIFPTRAYPGRSLSENEWKPDDIEKDFRAQIGLALKRSPRITHLSHHMGCNSLGAQVKAWVRRLANEYRIHIEPGESGVTNLGYAGPSKTSEEKFQSFVKMLESLQAGKTYLFVDHPGLDTPELRAIHHVGYENVAADRQGVTDTWTHPHVRDLIKEKGIQLISYRELKQ